MSPPLLANILFEQQGEHTILHAMPIMLGVLCILAIAYRYLQRFPRRQGRGSRRFANHASAPLQGWA